ncbi:NET1-associated nuclear protein 1 [Saitoella coloradoensis]
MSDQLQKGNKRRRSSVKDPRPLVATAPAKAEKKERRRSSVHGQRPEKPRRKSLDLVSAPMKAEQDPLAVLIKRATRKTLDVKKSSRTPSAPLTVTRTAGGRFSDKLEPIFTKDERNVLIAAGSSVKVYSAITGDLLRTLTPGEDEIVGMGIDPTNPFRLMTATTAGFVSVHDWTDGYAFATYNFNRTIKHFAIPATENTTLYIASPAQFSSSTKERTDILQIRLPTKLGKAPTVVNLASVNGECLGLITSVDSLAVAILTPRTITVGTRPTVEIAFEFRRFDAQSHSAPFTTLAFHREHLAVGSADGQIRIYTHVTSALTTAPVVRTFHWHANPVSSLSFVLDETYLLSGGAEGVLVFWQLETGKKTFLPRLGAAIRGVGVGLTGGVYAASLSDNSVKVISATDLRARVQITGIQASSSDLKAAIVVPSTVHPLNGNLILASAPQAGSSSALQSFDFTTDAQTTRTEVSRSTMIGGRAATGNGIQEPKVLHVAVGPDGQWLCTVDEWVPPVEERLSTMAWGSQEEKECYLKFWKWNAEFKKWDLITRVDAPHGYGASISALVANPKNGAQSFATLGSDGAVKIWKARTRVDKNGREKEVTWTCRRNIQYVHCLAKAGHALAWSVDGSLIAVNVGDDDVVLLLDARTGEVRKALGGFSAGRILSLGIVGATLVVSGIKKLVTYDLVLGKIRWTAKTVGGKMAINHAAAEFAIASSTPKNQGGDKITVWKTSGPASTGVHEVKGAVSAIHHVKAPRSGYIYFDSEGKVAVLERGGTGAVQKAEELTTKAIEELSVGALSATYGSGTVGRVLASTQEKNVDEEPQAAVVNSDLMSQMFDAPPYAMPSLEDMFESLVVGLAGTEAL